jgi:predicted ATPase
MWVEELTIENIKCFDKLTIRFGSKTQPFNWVNLLGENGTGKSTVLQALGLLLAGPEGANLLLKPEGWLKNESQYGRIGIRVHQGKDDPGKFGVDQQRKVFGYSFFVTAGKRISIRGKEFSEPTIVENSDKILTWLKKNALSSDSKGWFAAGFGPFRRLTRENQIVVPTLSSPARHTNFITQFNEDKPLAALEQWLVYLDYRIAKSRDKKAQLQKELGVEAINKVLPKGRKFDSISDDGRIVFDVDGIKVASVALSDGYRSILALAGDLIWRTLEAYPDSSDIMNEHGIVLIDELDIHLHPAWQRSIASKLRELFPKMQFIVATHSPLIAAGAGLDAVTYRMYNAKGKPSLTKIENIAFWDVDRTLRSSAFGLVSTYSEEAQTKMDRYFVLAGKQKRSTKEENEMQTSLPFVADSLRSVKEEAVFDKALKALEKDK